ncbi:response regulator transcription factor [Flavobacterium sp.]|uniref:response regulator transcription factor n=1 Tax=Flavobacterium sp. TaxID=239 RepID=UPI00391BACC2
MKHNSLTLTLYVFIIFLVFPVKSYPNSFGMLMLAEKKVSINDGYDYSNNEKSFIDITKKEGFNDSPNYENLHLKNLKQLNILLTLLVVLLCLSILVLWKKNMALGHETSQIKSSLNQYLFNTTSKEDLKSIKEEQTHQALTLNERQQKIVDLMAFGYSNKQIADKLFISENTVKYHIKNIYHVLHVKDRKQLWLSQS